MPKVHVRVEGVRECVAALRGLKASIANRVLAQAVAKRASEVNKLAKANLRAAGQKARRDARGRVVSGGSAAGLLRQSIGVKRAKVKRPYVVAAVVGPRKAFAGVGPDGRKHLPHKIAHLVEGGRRSVTATNKRVLAAVVPGSSPPAGTVFGKRVRAVPGQHFMARAYTAARGGWKARMAADIRAGIEREAKRQAYRSGVKAARGLGRAF